jgi:hypothetical protein
MPSFLSTIAPRFLRRSHFAGSLLLICGLGLLLMTATVNVRADDDDDEVIDQQQLNARGITVLTTEVFDQYVFNNVNSADVARQQLDGEFALHLEAIDRVCKLSDAKKEKLKLAASADFKKFWDQYYLVRKKYLNTRVNQQEPNNAFTFLATLRQQWQNGLISESSLFYKVINSTLQPEQLADFQKEEAARTKFRYGARIKLVISQLNEVMPMSARQRQQLQALLEETTPPKRFGQYDVQYVLLQFSNLSQDKLGKVFDAEELKAANPAFNNIRQQMRGYEQIMTQQGMMP